MSSKCFSQNEPPVEEGAYRGVIVPALPLGPLIAGGLIFFQVVLALGYSTPDKARPRQITQKVENGAAAGHRLRCGELGGPL